MKQKIVILSMISSMFFLVACADRTGTDGNRIRTAFRRNE